MKPATELEISTFELIQKNKINDAFIVIAKYELQQERPRGINVPWAEYAKTGLSKDEQMIYLMAMSVQLNLPPELVAFEDDIRSMSILAQMLGQRAFYAPDLFQKFGYKVEPYKKLPQELRFEIYKAENKIRSYLTNLLHINNYKITGFKYYGINTVDDEKRCQFCKDMEGKKLEIENVHVGINCPPFHDLCRCCIFPTVR